MVTDPDIREKLAQLTISGRIIREAPVSIAVFLDTTVSYHREKDIQSIGACIENMLLAAHCLGLGSVWLGEILKNADKVKEILDVPESYDFMALVAIGYPAREGKSERKPLKEVIFNWI
ncbi:nitroreductase family protein [Thermosulfidibacter takaii ABI70S6]|uniref:Nitroreductase family protein n=1 Tax=Thermosulfidibacter takaii (strain DSM 17441 / JCM 13301 / NBRC 103674 / ABI70S6) TaxID=1298851 RepID=A0A0S3QR72_THET7|nr:nitroreductase family protein [Thermosulfidibacter takaii ABI70S6]